MFFFFRERREGREKERERNLSMCERNINPLPQTGTEPATQACALPGNRSGDYLLCRAAPNQLSHTGQSPFNIFAWQLIMNNKPLKAKLWIRGRATVFNIIIN